jgi:hypothetical protein
MSAEDLINQSLTPPADEIAPRGEPRVMSDAYAAPEEKRKEYHGDDSSAAAAAAADLTRAREERGAREQPEVARQYLDTQTGERMPGNETVSLERAADDLTRIRSQEQQQAVDAEKDVFRFAIDATRQGHDPVELLQQQLAQQQQQAEQPAQQQEAQSDQIQPQPTTEPSVDPEIADALSKSPKLRAALEQAAQREQQVHGAAQQAQAQFLAAAQQAETFAVQTMLATFPEFQGVSVEQLPAALQVLKASNPTRHAEAVQHLARVDQLSKANQLAQAQQRQQTEQQVQSWAAQQDSAVDAYLAQHEQVETVKAVKAGLPKVLESYGISPAEFGQAVRQVPLLRSAPMQRMLYDLAKQHVLREQMADKVAKPAAPVVQRPGTAQPKGSYADSEVAAAREAFFKNPNDPKAAARYITAKRNS